VLAGDQRHACLKTPKWDTVHVCVVLPCVGHMVDMLGMLKLDAMETAIINITIINILQCSVDTSISYTMQRHAGELLITS
jgi:hypothetical protein